MRVNSQAVGDFLYLQIDCQEVQIAPTENKINKQINEIKSLSVSLPTLVYDLYYLTKVNFGVKNRSKKFCDFVDRIFLYFLL